MFLRLGEDRLLKVASDGKVVLLSVITAVTSLKDRTFRSVNLLQLLATKLNVK